MGRQSDFTREEKIAAVKLVKEGGRSVLSVANEYGIHENTLFKWKRQYSINPEGAFTGAPVADSAEAENERLKRRVRELENEVDFLKKYRRISRKARRVPSATSGCRTDSIKKRLSARSRFAYGFSVPDKTP